MASIVLSPIVTQIVEKLTDLALHQISLFCALQTELQSLKRTVSAIHAVLLDAEEQQFHNRQVKDWLEKLSETMYDVDDLLDDFSTEAARKKLAAEEEDDDHVERRKTTCWSTTVCSSPKQLMYGYRMAREIRAIREKLELLSKDKDNFHLEVRVDGDDLASLPLRETDSCPPTIVVGRKDDHSKIVELLLDFECEDNISVVPIVGIGGLGKTTLAQLAFDDERMKRGFEIKVWVYVSQNFDIKAILAKMLESINRKSQPADLALDVLQVLLQEKIRGKRFLFVLDDVWEENDGSWEALGKYLTVGAPGSKVLVTTRSRLVAEVSSKILKPATSTSTVVLPYFLEGLSLDEAWSLMVKKAFSGVVPRNSDAESIAREILGRCCGVPLAVNMVAGLLSSTDPETEWPLFLHKELWTISEGENPIMSALRLSFNHLPTHLRRCFAYCKLFPKGHVFDVQRLVQFWRAQGYIESGDRGLEINMGLQYFKTLWWRSFFQEVEMDELGSLQRCRMHDLMHELAASVTGTKILKRPKPAILEHASSKTRHLAVVRYHGDVVGEVHNGSDGIGDASKVRTLISDDVSFIRQECERVLNDFIRLRVLVLYVRGLDSDASSKLLHSVGELKHLRFLRLNFDGMAKLPDSITNLVNLQVLDLSWCRLLKELPRDIKKLVNLMHLYLYPLGVKLTHMPKGIGELTSLQTLPVFVVSKNQSRGNDKSMEEVGELDELKGLNALRGELTIRNLAQAESVGYGVHVLKEKPFLQYLVLDWEYNNNDDDDDDGDYASTNDEEILETLCPHPNLKKLMILNYGGTKLPNWLSTITNLVELSLEGFRECEYLPPLHQLPSLRELMIDGCPNLKGFWINNRNEVMEDEDWPYFPCLHRLEVLECPNLTRMPLFPTLAGGLELCKTGSLSLIRTMNMKAAMTTTMPTSPLSKLTSLRLVEMDDLKTLPEEGLSNLTSLQTLEIVKCSRLASLGAVRNLPSLQKLEILDCPLLNDRCRKGEGEDWPSISHVPEIMLDGRAFKWGL